MNLMKFRALFFAISLSVLLPGIYFLVQYGLRPSIDFVGGSLLEVQFAEPIELSTQQAQELVGEEYSIQSIQSTGDTSFVLKGNTIDNDQKTSAVQALSTLAPAEAVRFETVGPTLSRELLIKMLTAVGLVAGMITLYVWKQFHELKYGVCAILAMLHDSLVLLGVFAALGYFLQVEVDVLFVTAVLTTLSFSIHDTIVVYDRIRELRRKHPRVAYESVLNASVLETLSRSLNNSITIIIMLTVLTLLGGSSIQWFSFALLIGAITGTYSSSFVAVPLLLVWEQVAQQRKRWVLSKNKS